MRRPDAPPRLAWLVPALAAATLAAFAGGLGNGFVPYDDDVLIYRNPDLLRLAPSWEGVRWAFTTVQMGNWCPATHLSLLVTKALFGLDPWGWHATDLALHTGAAALLLAALVRATGDPLRSALVAGLFALHPLRAESVAWASERRDVMCGFFWMAAVLAHVRYTERPSRWRGAAVLAASTIALLSKSMAVTLPATMLLLDVWPLGRIRIDAGLREAWSGLRPCLREKLPLFALAAVVAAVTFYAQREVGAMHGIDALPPAIRLQNAAVSMVEYARRFLWPADLVFFYPFDARTLTPLRVGGAAVGLALGVLLAVRARRRAPAVTVGLLWYAGTLLPVIGLVQVGSQASADRYTYLPSIGLALAVAWALPDSLLATPLRRRITVSVGLAWLALLGFLTARQVTFWRDGDALYGRALAVDPANAVAHHELGRLRIAQGRVPEAVEHLERGARGMPRSADAQATFGAALGAVGRTQEAERAFARALAIDPRSVGARLGLGRLLVESGRPAEALPLLEEVVRREPDRPLAHLLIGVARERTGDPAGAIAPYREALRLGAAGGGPPISAVAAAGLARVLLAQPGRNAAAVQEAVRWAEEASRATGGRDAAVQETLAQAYTESGRNEEAARARGGR